MTHKVDVIRCCVCTAKHIICADCNVKSAAHFFIQNSITAQIRHIGVHAKAKFTDNSVFRGLLLEKVSNFRLIAIDYPPFFDMQPNTLVFSAVKVECFKINRTLRFILDRGNVNLTTWKIAI